MAPTPIIVSCKKAPHVPLLTAGYATPAARSALTRPAAPASLTRPAAPASRSPPALPRVPTPASPPRQPQAPHQRGLSGLRGDFAQLGEAMWSGQLGAPPGGRGHVPGLTRCCEPGRRRGRSGLV